MRKFKRVTKSSFDRFIHNENGATAIEYAIIAAFLSIVIAATVYVIGGDLNANYYQPVADAL